MTWLKLKRTPLADVPEGTSPLTVWVVFADGVPRWWDRFLEPGYRHVFAMYQSRGWWVLIDSRLDFLDVRMLDVPRWSTFEEAVPYGYSHAYLVESFRPAGRIRSAVGWMASCVEVVKHLVGVRGFLVVTPKQLALELTRRCQVRRIIHQESSA